jgi:hypothetical protein
MSSEITFILPNNEQTSTANSSTELEDTQKVKNNSQNIPSDIRVLIIWLEQLQDSDNIPLGTDNKFFFFNNKILL